MLTSANVISADGVAMVLYEVIEEFTSMTEVVAKDVRAFYRITNI